ncbi:MAG: radical SAM family heme chaperone HemW [Anaerolineales bacterium]
MVKKIKDASGINKLMNYSVYIHVPFCKHRCHYCDFVTYAGMERLIPDYFDALIKEMQVVLQNSPHLKIQSIYFGGGTPSIVPIVSYQKLFEALLSLSNLSEDCEISLEANPGTLNVKYLEELKRLGFNRLSLGVQSTNNLELLRLDRIHTVDDVLNSVHEAKLAGFANINLDLMFGLPGQALKDWEQSLSRAVVLKPQHFSLYSLIIEPGTSFFKWYQQGLLSLQDQDLEAEMFENAMSILQLAGYEHYEISNWARIDSAADFRCRHNLQYWLNQPYLGFGAGAHGYVDRFRTKNTPVIPDYIHRMNTIGRAKYQFPFSPATLSSTPIDKQTEMNEFMMMGLRLVKLGVSNKRIQNLFGMSIMDAFGEEINKLLAKGLLERFGEESQDFRLSKLGVMLGNQVFMMFV